MILTSLSSFRSIRLAYLEQLSLLLLEVHSCLSIFAFVTVGYTKLTSTMVVQVGLLITVHGERCTAS